MKVINEISKKRLSWPVASCGVIIALSGATFFENKALYPIDHPKPHNVSCIGCHSDAKTLRAIAEKSGDKLYLVHQGQVTEGQLQKLLAVESAASKGKAPSTTYK